MRVLMASNDETFAPSLALAYKDRGCDIIVGLANFRRRLAHYDLVHLHWPEELVGFEAGIGNSHRQAEALALIDAWRESTVMVATVHNLIPHVAPGFSASITSYFEQFYRRMDVICHYSQDSLRRFAGVYPSIPADRQIVQPLNLFSHLLPLAKGREEARRTLALPAKGPVFAVLGALRKREEVLLLQNAWNLARRQQPDIQLIFAARTPWEYAGKVRRIPFELPHRLWLKRHDIVEKRGMLSDGEMVPVIEAANAILIPRFGHHLNSGLLPLAMTFGTNVVAPAYGIYKEVAETSGIDLYNAGDAFSMADAIVRAAGRDPEKTAEDIRLASQFWGWDRILDHIWPDIDRAFKEKGRLQG